MAIFIIISFVVIFIIYTTKSESHKDRILNENLMIAYEKYYNKFKNKNFYKLRSDLWQIKVQIQELRNKYGDERFEHMDYIDLCGQYDACTSLLREKDEGDLDYDYFLDEYNFKY